MRREEIEIVDRATLVSFLLVKVENKIILGRKEIEMSRLTAATLAATLFAASIAKTAGATPSEFLDFNDQPAGQVITDQYLGSGVSFSLVGTFLPAGPTIFEVPVPPSIFNISGGNLVPGAKTFGVPQYDLQMTFSQRVDFLSIFALDAEEPFSIKAYLGTELVAIGTSNVVGALGLPTAGPVVFGSVGSIGGGLEFDRVVLDITNGDGSDQGGPENFDNLTFHQVPEPATLGMFAAGILFLGVMRTRARILRSRAG